MQTLWMNLRIFLYVNILYINILYINITYPLTGHWEVHSSCDEFLQIGICHISSCNDFCWMTGYWMIALLLCIYGAFLFSVVLIFLL